MALSFLLWLSTYLDTELCIFSAVACRQGCFGYVSEGTNGIKYHIY